MDKLFENLSLTECNKEEVNLISTLPIQTAIESSSWDKISPETNWISNESIDFTIPGSSTHYIDMSQIQLYLRFQVLATANDGQVVDTKNVSLTNNTLHTLFKNITTLIEDKLIASDNNMYHMRAYIENNYGYNAEAKKTLLRGDGWFKDSGNFDLVDSEGVGQTFVASQPGFVERKKWILNKNTVELCGNLHLDISTADKLLFSGNTIKLSLTKNDNKVIFCGSDSKDYYIKFLSAFLLVRRVVVALSIMLAHANALLKMPAQYPYKRVIVKHLNGTAGSNVGQFSVYTGTLPVRVLVGFVDTDALTGNYKKNSFNFKHFKIQEIEFKINSVVAPYSKAIECNFDKNCYFQAYTTLFKNIKDAPCDINYDEYANGNTLFAFNLSPDLCTQEHTSLIQTGSLYLDVKFAETPTTAYSAVFYLEKDSKILIGKSGEVIVEK